MPSRVLPLVPSYTQRGPLNASLGDKDQRIRGALVKPVQNHAEKTVTYEVEKRAGLVAPSNTVVASGQIGTAIFVSPSSGAGTIISAFGTSTSSVYKHLTLQGALDGLCYQITESIISGVPYWLMTTSAGTGWFLANDATIANFTGDIANTSTTISNIASTSGFYVGQLVTNANLVAGTRIATVAANSITVTVAATGTSAGATIAREAVAKIIDSDFPSLAYGPMTEMDGYIFVMVGSNGANAATSRIYQSNLNSVVSWGASDYITANMTTDTGVGCIKYRNQIMGCGGRSIEFFYNAGNASGSVLSRTEQAFINIGVVPSVPVNSDFPTGYLMVAQTGPYLFFVGAPVGNFNSIYVMDGFTPVKISDPIIDALLAYKIINNFDAFEFFGMTYLHVGATLSTGGYTAISLLYCVEAKKWVESGFDAGYRFAGVTQATTLVSSLIGSTLLAVSNTKTNGKIHFISSASSPVYQDDSTDVPFMVQIGPIDNGDGRRVRDVSIELLADNQATGTSTLLKSDNDGTSWETVGTFPLTATRKIIWNCGSYEGGRMYRVTDTNNQAWRGRALRINYEVSEA